MNRSKKSGRIDRTALRRRAVTLSVLILLVMAWAAAAFAQTSPPYPPLQNVTPSATLPQAFSWPGFHAGGAYSDFNPAGAYRDLYSELMGTPSGLYPFPPVYKPSSGKPAGSYVTQIPSFELGYFDPTQPAPGTLAAPAPNFFGDQFDAPLHWDAPFEYQYTQLTLGEITDPAITKAAVIPALTVDDDNANNAATPIAGLTPTFTNSGGWPSSSGGFAADPESVSTATNGEYKRFPVVGRNGNGAVSRVRWTPVVAQQGSYSVYVNIPDSAAASVSAVTEGRITDAQYTITYYDILGKAHTETALVSQSESNHPQFVAGPFYVRADVAAQPSITVTLDNTTADTNINFGNTFVVADSMTLTPDQGSQVLSSPTAINSTEYPEIRNAQYWGVSPGTESTPDTTFVHGNATSDANEPTGNTSADAAHAIRQLVYFGRSENVLDVHNGVGSGTLLNVGAIYCVDGITGSVVWRYQTPTSYYHPYPNDPNPAKAATILQYQPSMPVFSTPTIARINVIVGHQPAVAPAVGEQAVYATKLVVIVGDESGKVYCLDAVGNRDGTSNNAVLINPLTGAPDPVTGQPNYVVPPYDPMTQLPSAAPAHVGSTRAYWVYRPDPLKPKYVLPITDPNFLTRNRTVKKTQDFNANSDLPVPASFSLASPSVYINPTVTTQPVSPPGTVSTITTLTSNATVYIGNSNGVLYSLDALGLLLDTSSQAQYDNGAASGDAFNSSLDIRNTPNVFPENPTDPIVPTPGVNWWFTIRGTLNTSGVSDNPNSPPSTLSAASIQSAPAIQVNPADPSKCTVYVTSVSEGDDTSNMGRLYAVDSTGPVAFNNPAKTLPPGQTGYNANQRAKWSFPDAYGDAGRSSSGKPRPALGNISGSPVVFTNPDDAFKTLVFIAANSGLELAPSTAGDPNPSPERPAVNDSGRVWGIDPATGNVYVPAGGQPWVYPQTWDPNNAANDKLTTDDESPPMGSFQNATPAIGFVQFPRTITNGDLTTFTHADRFHADVKGQYIPMLYVGTSGSGDAVLNGLPGLYMLDVDGGNEDDRDVYIVPSPNGAAFQSSPALVVNPSTRDGNSGALFATVGESVYQFSATPVTNIADINHVQPFPMVNIEAAYSGYGPISSPAVAGTDIRDLIASVAPVANGDAPVSNWLYVGDSTLGFCRALSPYGGGVGTYPGVNFGIAIGGNLLVPGGTYGGLMGLSGFGSGNVPLQLPLHTYLMPSSVAGASDTNMNDALNKPGASSNLSVYEWGQNVYVRVGNVVPPNPTNDPKYQMRIQGDDTGVYYTNGGPVNYTVDEYDASGRQRSHTQSSVAPVIITTLPGDGFVLRGDTGVTQDEINFTDTAGERWLAAFTYAIRDGTGHKNTPGSHNRFIEMTQQVEERDSNNNIIGHPILTTIATQGYFARTRNKAGAISATAIQPSDLPTFGILNPLAVRGGGVPLALGPVKPNNAIAIGFDPGAAAPGPADTLNGVGPFRGVAPDLSNPASLPYDLQALANGNRVYTKAAPPSGLANFSPINSRAQRRALRDAYPERTRSVITATGFVSPNTSGDNADIWPNKTLPQGSLTLNNFNGLNTSVAGPNFGPYALDIADRSALGLAGLSLQRMTMQREALRWDDNSVDVNGNMNNGPGAVVNPLPWDDTPISWRVGANRSIDYPDVGAGATTETLHTTTGSSDLSDKAAAPDPALLTGGATTVENRIVTADSTQVLVKMPKYQPANLQLWDQTLPAYLSNPVGHASESLFPMGYVETQRVYIDSNNNKRWDRDEAYRDVRVYAGVPIDMETSIANQTTDIGKVPAGFGVQADQYVQSLAVANPALLHPPFDFSPFDPYYQSAFKPLTIYNNGNVNLLNVHMDQKLNLYDAPGNITNPTSLMMTADPLDPLAVIPGWDFSGASGPVKMDANGVLIRTDKGGNPLPLYNSNIDQQPFLIRTNLDTDLVAAYGRNLGVLTLNSPSTGTPLSTYYQGATFHKPRVGDSTPSVLTVPDVPHDNDPSGANIRTGPFSLVQASPGNVQIGTVGSNPVLVYDNTSNASDPNNGRPAAMVPSVGLAVPIGTPVGTYSQNLRLFEGIDTKGYSTGDGFYNALLSPNYGGWPDNATTPGTDYLFNDFLTPLYPGNSNSLTLLPYSDPGTVLKATVVETRLTDGATAGSLPQVDNPNANPSAYTPTPDIFPSAIRDAYWSGGKLQGSGALDLFWTTGRNYTSGTTAPYSIYGALLPFLNNSFVPNNPNGNWWGASAGPVLTSLPDTNYVNTALSLTQEQTIGGAFNSTRRVYAFVDSVNTAANAPTSTAYNNTIYCFPVNPATAQVDTTAGADKVVSDNPAQAKYDPHGLMFTNQEPFPDASGAATNRNLFAFWYAGTRGRTALYYSSAHTDNTGAIATLPANASRASQYWETNAVLPVPAGIVSVSDPSAFLVSAPDPNTGAPLATIEVTYSGVGADGNADIYVSRYLPYHPQLRNAARTVDSSQTFLAPMAFPTINEALQPDTSRNWWQARNVAWLRNANFNITIDEGGVQAPILRNFGSPSLLPSIKASYDQATGTEIFTGVHLPDGKGGTLTGQTLYVDGASGRVRFSTTLPADALVYATDNAMARRITTDPRADSAPVAFIDPTYKNNLADNKPQPPGLTLRVPTDRYWFIWRKLGGPGTSTTPTLWYKTQRLTVVLHDAKNQPISILLNSGGAPQITVTDITGGGSNVLYNGSATSVVDVDWARGRLYFPIEIQTTGGPIALEGRTIKATFTYKDSNGVSQTTPYTIVDTPQWMDEPVYNDIKSLPGKVVNGAGLTTATNGIGVTDPSEANAYALPIDTAINESSVSAFLDPLAYANVAGGSLLNNIEQPHKVWVFWTSTRNGTSDLYYMTIDPRFAPEVAPTTGGSRTTP